MRNPGGYAISSGGDAPTVETDTTTCGHCGTVYPLPPKHVGFGFCKSCTRDLCEPCADKYPTRGCENFMRKVERHEERDYRRRSFRKAAGLE